MGSRVFSRKFWTWQRVQAEEIAFKSLDKEVKWLIIFAFAYVILGYGIGQLVLNYPIPLMGATNFVQDFWYAIIFKLVFLLIFPALIYFLKWKYSLKDLILGFNPSISNWLIGTLLIMAGFFLNSGHLREIQEQFPHFQDAWLRLTTGVILPLLIAALPEELFFRGYLQTRLEKKWNRFAAILISSLLFTAWHLPSRYLLSFGIEGQAGDLIGVLIGTGLPVFMVSSFFGLHWSRYRNIILLILVHWAIDILPSLSSFFGIPY